MIAGGITNKKLKWGYWYVNNKLLVRRIWIYFLIFVNLNLWIFALFFVFKVYYFDQPNFYFSINQLSAANVNYSTFNLSNQPKPLTFSNVSVLKSRGNKYDLLVAVTNPNSQWSSRASSRFVMKGESFPEQVFSILPNETKYIVEAGIDAAKVDVTPQFLIDNYKWERVRSKSLFNRFVAERTTFEVTDVNYIESRDMKLGTQVPVASVSFTLKNNGLFDYWLVNNKILFKRGGTIVAVSIIPVEQFKAGETRKVDFRVFDVLVGVTSIEVKPEVDIYDDNNIIEEPLVVGEVK